MQKTKVDLFTGLPRTTATLTEPCNKASVHYSWTVDESYDDFLAGELGEHSRLSALRQQVGELIEATDSQTGTTRFSMMFDGKWVQVGTQRWAVDDETGRPVSFNSTSKHSSQVRAEMATDKFAEAVE